MKSYPANQIRNVAIIGHSGVGKTTIAEACLHVSGVSKRFGRVEEGNTVSDYDPEEIKRKISINSSIIPVEWLEEKINFIDTPGYFDFLGEVKQALSVSDLALIVVDAKAGVQVGTEKAWQIATEMGIPKMIFVNGMDDESADLDTVVESMKQVFGKSIAPLQVPFYEDNKFVGFVNVIRRAARKFMNGLVEPCDMPDGLDDSVETMRKMVEEAVAETDDELIEKFFNDESMTPEEREHPELMNSSRKKRISQGSGIPLHELNIYINQFEQMRKMMKGFSDVKKVIGGNPNKAKLTAHQMMKNMRRFR